MVPLTFPWGEASCFRSCRSRTNELLSIGRFAQLTGLTAKALRHYDELGLLRPAHVDDIHRLSLVFARAGA